MDIRTFLQQLQQRRQFELIALNELSQFGLPGQQLVGATLLPERQVTRNQYTETGIRYRTVIAADGDRYSPAQKRGRSVQTGSWDVKLGNSDIATQFTSHDLDTVVQMIAPLTGLGTPAGMAAAAQVLNWSNTAINMALQYSQEKHRWQAILNGTITRMGDGGTETVSYPGDPMQRQAAGGDWTDPDYNILADLLAAKLRLTAKGYMPNRLITSTAVQNVMLANKSLALAAGFSNITISGGGIITQQQAGGFNEEALNALMRRNGLPAIEVYDATYNDDRGVTDRFMAQNALVLAATTGRNERVALAQNPNVFRFLENTLGYHAVGIGTGQVSPGRVIRVTYHEDKPPRLNGEGWVEHLPVFTDPEAFQVIHTIPLP